MNNYELFNFENINNNINVLKPMNEYKKNVNYLYNGVSDAKPFEDVPDKLYRDEFLEQDIKIDIDSNRFRKVWQQYKNLYDEKNSLVDNYSENIKDDEKDSFYEQELESFYIKAKEFTNYLNELKEEKKKLAEKKELLELTKKELEQEKELLDIEKEKFEDYKISEEERLNKDKIKFQNFVEEMKKKIETILK